MACRSCGKKPKPIPTKPYKPGKPMKHTVTPEVFKKLTGVGFKIRQ